MRVTKKQIFVGLLSLIVVASGYFLWQAKAAPDGKQTRNPVQVVKSGIAEQKTIPITIRANGNVAPMNTVEVRPQAQNIVRGVHVKEGQQVRAGQKLFTLDQRSDASDVARAQAQLGRDRADLVEAEAALKRNRDLVAKNFVSQAVLDTAQARVDALRATKKANQAAVQSSNIALGNNRITASISGRIGAISVHPGSLAQPGGAPMLTIAQLDPVLVNFSVPERELGHILASYPNGEAPVVVMLADGHEVSGQLIFIDNAADMQTGTIRMKARFANAERRLWPGAYVSVALVARTLPDAVVVPAHAIVTGPTEKFVYVIGADDTVKVQPVAVTTIANGQAAVTGLAAGTKIVVEGAQNLRPGGKVKEMTLAPASDDNTKLPEKRTKKDAA